MSATRVDLSTERYDASEPDRTEEDLEKREDEGDIDEGVDVEVTHQTPHGKYFYRICPHGPQEKSGGAGKKARLGALSARRRRINPDKEEAEDKEADDASGDGASPRSPSIGRNRTHPKHDQSGSGQHGDSDGQSSRGAPRLLLNVKAGSQTASIDPMSAPYLEALRDAITSADSTCGPSVGMMVRCMLSMYGYLRAHQEINARAALQQFHLLARAARDEHAPMRRGAGLDEIVETMTHLEGSPSQQSIDALSEQDKTLNLLAVPLMLSAFGPQSKDHKRMLSPRTRVIAMHANKVG